MHKKLSAVFILMMASLCAHAEITIEQCVQKATDNYPLIKKYELLTSFKEIDLSDINKGWLPRISIYGQLTGQNIVPSFPEALSNVLHTMGQEINGIGKFQYKIGADVSQTIWDGGSSKARREMVRAQKSVEEAGLNVELYKVRERVENLYFAIMLTEEQIAQSRITYDLLCCNLEKLRSMYRNGVATQSDVDMMESRLLTMNQNILQAQSSSASYRKALEIFTGEELTDEKLVMPIEKMPADNESNRPELDLFTRKIGYIDAGNRLSQTGMMPHVGLFAQAYYGYPGINYFQSMVNRNLSFNIIAGVKVSWNIDSFYTRKNNSRRTSLNTAEIMADRELFLFNTRVQSESQYETIKGLKELMKDDSRIVQLHQNVRKAAESQLDNGVIDITDLLAKISEENISQLTSKYHRILLLQEIYKLKFTLDQ